MLRQASLPDVEGGIPAARKKRGNADGSQCFKPVVCATVFSAGLGSPALRQARMPAATLAISPKFPADFLFQIGDIRVICGP
jgi:hypothetical protein